MNPNPPAKTADRKTFLIALSAYILWGFVPLYWKLLGHFAPTEILAHRFIWAFVFYSLVLVAFGRRRQFTARPTGRSWAAITLATAVIAVNWGVYVYAINSNQVLESSLAYFLNPILNVAVGVVFFKEHFPTPLKIAVGLALLGVGTLLVASPTFPWIALALATTFCSYGVIKKLVPVDAVLGSAMEGVIGLVPALVGAWFLRQGASNTISTTDLFLLAGGGVVTGLPLVLFSHAAQKVPYSLMGVMQFTAPTLQFLIGWLVYGENLSPTKLMAYGLVWLGVAFYLSDRLTKLKGLRWKRPK